MTAFKIPTHSKASDQGIKDLLTKSEHNEGDKEKSKCSEHFRKKMYSSRKNHFILT